MNKCKPVLGNFMASPSFVWGKFNWSSESPEKISGIFYKIRDGIGALIEFSRNYLQLIDMIIVKIPKN